MGVLEKMVNPDGTIFECQYDEYANRTNFMTRDANEKLISRKTRSYVYFSGTSIPSNLTEQIEDADGNVLGKSSTTWQRDDNGTATNIYDDVYTLVSEKTWITTNEYEETKYVYNTNNLLSEIQVLVSGTNDYRTIKKYTYNSNWQVTAVSDAMTNTVYAVYDDLNRITNVYETLSDGTTNHTYYAYDNLDRVTQITYPDGASESWTYAPCGCGVLTHTDRIGNLTTNTFNVNKEIWKTQVISTNGTVLAYTENFFDTAGNVTNSYDALSNGTVNIYNSANELSKTIDALGNETEYLYNCKGQQYMAVYADGSVSSNTYDAAGRLITVSRYACAGSATALSSEQYAYVLPAELAS